MSSRSAGERSEEGSEGAEGEQAVAGGRERELLRRVGLADGVASEGSADGADDAADQRTGDTTGVLVELGGVLSGLDQEAEAAAAGRSDRTAGDAADEQPGDAVVVRRRHVGLVEDVGRGWVLDRDVHLLGTVGVDLVAERDVALEEGVGQSGALSLAVLIGRTDDGLPRGIDALLAILPLALVGLVPRVELLALTLDAGLEGGAGRQGVAVGGLGLLGLGHRLVGGGLGARGGGLVRGEAGVDRGDLALELSQLRAVVREPRGRGSAGVDRVLQAGHRDAAARGRGGEGRAAGRGVGVRRVDQVEGLVGSLQGHTRLDLHGGEVGGVGLLCRGREGDAEDERDEDEGLGLHGLVLLHGMYWQTELMHCARDSGPDSFRVVSVTLRATQASMHCCLVIAGAVGGVGAGGVVGVAGGIGMIRMPPGALGSVQA